MKIYLVLWGWNLLLHIQSLSKKNKVNQWNTLGSEITVFVITFPIDFRLPTQSSAFLQFQCKRMFLRLTNSLLISFFNKLNFFFSSLLTFLFSLFFPIFCFESFFSSFLFEWKSTASRNHATLHVSLHSLASVASVGADETRNKRMRRLWWGVVWCGPRVDGWLWLMWRWSIFNYTNIGQEARNGNHFIFTAVMT